MRPYGTKWARSVLMTRMSAFRPTYEVGPDRAIVPMTENLETIRRRIAGAERLSNIHYYMSDPSVRKLAWKGRLDHPAWRAQPNAGHRALVALVTQNIDGLHQRAGSSPDIVIEVHGTMREAICMSGCGWRGPWSRCWTDHHFTTQSSGSYRRLWDRWGAIDLDRPIVE